jgi:hypothetical protein
MLSLDDLQERWKGGNMETGDVGAVKLVPTIAVSCLHHL